MRLIDADALFVDLDGMMAVSPTGYIHGDTVADMISDAPTIEPEQHWIPCSERLPENKSYVLTTIYVPGRFPHSRSGWFEDGLFMNDNGDTWKCTDREVIAWMPLPEPYKGEADGPIR